MQKALELAAKAALKDEVPVGAILVQNDQVIAQGYNHRESWNSVLAHAELIAIQRASNQLQAWRLLNMTLYVTLEPCLMCSGAIQQARIPRVVFGAHDAKGGALVSLYQVGSDSRLNHRFAVTGGVLEDECRQILKVFFKGKRLQK